jgi:hypothetical protein
MIFHHAINLTNNCNKDEEQPQQQRKLQEYPATHTKWKQQQLHPFYPRRLEIKQGCCPFQSGFFTRRGLLLCFSACRNNKGHNENDKRRDHWPLHFVVVWNRVFH